MNSPEQGSTEPLLAQILEGKSPKLLRLAAEGILPLAAGDLVVLLVQLIQSETGEIARLAEETLQKMEPRVLAQVVGETDNEQVIAHLAGAKLPSAAMLALLRRRSLKSKILVDLAGRVTAEFQEVLLQRQDAIVKYPMILDALEANPKLSQTSRRRIGEYRDHLLAQGRTTPPSEASQNGSQTGRDEEVEAAIQEAKELPPEGELDDDTELSEAQIKSLPVAVRLKLSRNATRSLRNILLRDASKLVALSALQNNAFSDAEVERVASSRVVIDEILEAVSRNRRWIQRYEVARALVFNPRTPVSIALRLSARMSVRDLRNLSQDRNVPHVIRTQGGKLYRSRMK